MRPRGNTLSLRRPRDIAPAPVSSRWTRRFMTGPRMLVLAKRADEVDADRLEFIFGFAGLQCVVDLLRHEALVIGLCGDAERLQPVFHPGGRVGLGGSELIELDRRSLVGLDAFALLQGLVNGAVRDVGWRGDVQNFEDGFFLQVDAIVDDSN